MAGARASGKSLYIGVVVKLLEQLANRFDQPFAPTSATRTVYREHYERPLFEAMSLMGATPSSRSEDAYQNQPLIFRLGRWTTPRGEHDHFLVIRDVAGEDLESRTPVPQLNFMGSADLIIFLFDPLQVHQVKSNLKGLIPEQLELGGDPAVVLENLFGILQGRRPRLAVTVSKFDTVQQLGRLKDGQWKQVMGNPGSSLARDTGWDYRESDQRLVHLETQSLLTMMDARQLVNRLQAGYPDSRAIRYFAVSSLGQAPVGEELAREGIAPYRCLDPVRWLLWDNGLFRGTGS
ncbi:hypothetical protein [Corynebacterium heidelbergense]|nr:hypothetical protein [Corynebacterium heidelbergense]